MEGRLLILLIYCKKRVFKVVGLPLRRCILTSIATKRFSSLEFCFLGVTEMCTDILA